MSRQAWRWHRDFLKAFMTTIGLPGHDQKSNCIRWRGKGWSCDVLRTIAGFGGQAEVGCLGGTLHPWISRRGLLLLNLWILVLNGFEAKLSSHAIYCQIATTRHMPPLPHWKYKEHCDSGRRTQKKCGVVWAAYTSVLSKDLWSNPNCPSFRSFHSESMGGKMATKHIDAIVHHSMWTFQGVSW